jgi:hypothetical protein
MKSLALRACALIVLGWTAHSLKPFTSDNLTSFAAATTHSVAAWLPAPAAARLEKTAALASVFTNAWRVQNQTVVGLESMLAARLQPEQKMLPLKRVSQPRKAKAVVREEAAWEAFAPETADIEEVTETEEVITNAAEEAIQKLLQRAAIATPVAAETAPLPVFLNQKRAACPMPSVVGTEEPVSTPAVPKVEAEVEAAPAAEVEAQPVPTLHKHIRLPLEIEFEPVSFTLKPSASPVRSLLKRATVMSSKC